MRCFRASRWNSRSPGITGASGVAVRATGWTSSVTWSPAPITSGVVQWTLTPVRRIHALGTPLFAFGAVFSRGDDPRTPDVRAGRPDRKKPQSYQAAPHGQKRINTASIA